MKPASMLALLLIVLGVAALVFQGITYTRRETVVDIGPLQATTEERRTVPLPPLVGISAVGAGVAILLVRRRRT